VRLGNTGEGPFEDPECSRPLDLSALRADDALIDALGAGLVRPDVPYEGCAESDQELVALLAAWVAEVRPEGSEPLPHADLVSALIGQRPRPLAAVPDQPAAAPATVEPATPRPAAAGYSAPNRTGAVARPPVPPSERRGLLAQFGRRLAVAALLAGLASSGLAVGMGSEPDGASVAVSRVAYADKARSAAAAAQVTDELHVARTALEQGHRAEAARAITSIGQHLPAVRDDDGRARLARDHQRLREILAASGGPPAANDIVLAAVAPEVEPSDFLGNLADSNDRLDADTPPPAAPDPAAVPAPVPGQNGTGPSAVILADGPPPATEGRTAGSGAGASAGSPTTTASAPTSAGDPSTGPAAPGSSASESSNDSSVPETSATSAPETSSPESSSPESSSPRSSTSEKTTTKKTTESSTTRKTSAPETSAPETTAVPKPPSSATRTTEPKDDTSSASSPRSASPLPSSQDFIGPVADRPSQAPPSGAATGREATSRTSTSRTSTSDASSQADSGN
jgi:Anti-sigma-D factor RsdA to sigma factor binding region